MLEISLLHINLQIFSIWICNLWYDGNKICKLARHCVYHFIWSYAKKALQNIKKTLDISLNSKDLMKVTHRMTSDWRLDDAAKSPWNYWFYVRRFFSFFCCNLIKNPTFYLKTTFIKHRGRKISSILLSLYECHQQVDKIHIFLLPLQSFFSLSLSLMYAYENWLNQNFH